MRHEGTDDARRPRGRARRPPPPTPRPARPRTNVGAIIEDSAFHPWLQNAKATGAETRDWGPTVAPAHLADLLRDMHTAKSAPEAVYPTQ